MSEGDWRAQDLKETTFLAGLDPLSPGVKGSWVWRVGK